MGCSSSQPVYGSATDFNDQDSTVDLSIAPFLPPKPPKGRKEDVFVQQSYAAIDEHATRMPIDYMYESFEAVANYLCNKSTNDMGKLRSIFTWLTSVDIGKLQSTCQKVPEPQTPLDYLLQIHWQQCSHAYVFLLLCKAANMPCVIIRGINKSAAYQIGQKLNPAQLEAQWNAVLVDQQWRLVDVFWASTCVVGKQSGEWADLMKGDDDDDEYDEEDKVQHIVNEFFFIPNPDELVYTHLPKCPEWQLLSSPVRVQHFEEQTYIRERFFQLGCSINNPRFQKCLLQTNTGEVDILVEIGNEDTKVGFRYVIYKQRQPGRKEKPPPHPLERYVFCTKTGSELEYNIRLPQAGKYKLDIYGQDLNQHETFDLMCSYVIDSSQAAGNLNPLPDDPKIGWGPGQDCAVAGIKATTHKRAIIETDTGEVELRFDLANPLQIMQQLKSNLIDEHLLQRSALLRADDKEVILNLRFPKQGEYAVKLFAKSPSSTDGLANVCNYLVKCRKSTQANNPYPPTYNGILGVNPVSDALKVSSNNAEKIVYLSKGDGHFTVIIKHNANSEIFCEVTNKDVSPEHLSRIISTNMSGTDTTFNCLFEHEGEYALNFFSKSKDTDVCRVNHIQTYLMRVNGLPASPSDAPKPGAVQVREFSTTRDSYPVKLTRNNDRAIVAAVSRQNAVDTVNDKLVSLKAKGKQAATLTVSLPEDGVYIVKVYERDTDDTLVLKDVCYIHKRELAAGEEEEMLSEEELDPEEEERRRLAKAKEAEYKALRDQLRAAMMSQNEDQLKEAIKNFRANKVPDPKNDLGKAQQMLDYLRVSEALKVAMADRDMAALEKLVAEAEDKNLEKRLGLQLAMARQILEKLQRLEKLKKEILNLDQKTIAEIKSYSQPPKQVNQVMSAVFIVLGDLEESLKDWRAVQVLIGKTGKMGLKRRVGEFQVDKLPIELAVRVKTLLAPFDLEEVTDVSAGAATFYVWACTMVEEAESRFVAAGGDLQNIKKKKPRK